MSDNLQQINESIKNQGNKRTGLTNQKVDQKENNNSNERTDINSDKYMDLDEETLTKENGTTTDDLLKEGLSGIFEEIQSNQTNKSQLQSQTNKGPINVIDLNANFPNNIIKGELNLPSSNKMIIKKGEKENLPIQENSPAQNQAKTEINKNKEEQMPQEEKKCLTEKLEEIPIDYYPDPIESHNNKDNKEDQVNEDDYRHDSNTYQIAQDMREKHEEFYYNYNLINENKYNGSTDIMPISYNYSMEN